MEGFSSYGSWNECIRLIIILSLNWFEGSYYISNLFNFLEFNSIRFYIYKLWEHKICGIFDLTSQGIKTITLNFTNQFHDRYILMPLNFRLRFKVQICLENSHSLAILPPRFFKVKNCLRYYKTTISPFSIKYWHWPLKNDFFS